MKKTNILHKNSDLNLILSAHLKGMLNLSKINFNVYNRSKQGSDS
jgi:hypothetical protein